MTDRPQRLELVQDVRLERLAADGKGARPRRFRMTAYTGDAFDRWFGAAVIDLDGLELPPAEEGLAIFRQHDPRLFVGRGDKLTKGAELEVEGFLFDDVPAAREVAAISDQGGRWQASVGIDLDWDAIDEIGRESSVLVNGRAFAGPITVFRKTKLRESSFVPHGADAATSAVALNKEGKMPEPTTTKQTDQGAAERDRIKAIRSAFKADPDFALEAIGEGWSLTEAKAHRADRLEVQLAEQLAERQELEGKLAKQAEETAKATAAAARPSPASMLAAPGGSAPPASDDPIQAWEDALAAEVERIRQGTSVGAELRRTIPVSDAVNLRARAVHALSAREPKLREAYVEAFNKNRKGR